MLAVDSQSPPCSLLGSGLRSTQQRTRSLPASGRTRAASSTLPNGGVRQDGPSHRPSGLRASSIPGFPEGASVPVNAQGSRDLVSTREAGAHQGEPGQLCRRPPTRPRTSHRPSSESQSPRPRKRKHNRSKFSRAPERSPPSSLPGYVRFF